MIEETPKEIDSVEPVLEGRVLTPEEEAEVQDFAENVSMAYVCKECRQEVPRGLDNLMKHKKAGGDCDQASKMIEPAGAVYEDALLTKRNMEEISKRSGKTMSELNVMRKTLLSMGHGMRIKYKVVEK